MKGKLIWSDMIRGPLASFFNQLVKVSITIQRTVPASKHRQSVWSLYLRTSIRTLLLMIYQNSSGGRGLLSSLGIKESKAPGFLEPAAASVSKECFTCFPLLAQKALWHSSNLWFFCVLSLIIHCQLEYLQEATMECISKAVILWQGKLVLSFQVGGGTMCTLGLT